MPSRIFWQFVQHHQPKIDFLRNNNLNFLKYAELQDLVTGFSKILKPRKIVVSQEVYYLGTEKKKFLVVELELFLGSIPKSMIVEKSSFLHKI